MIVFPVALVRPESFPHLRQNLPVRSNFSKTRRTPLKFRCSGKIETSPLKDGLAKEPKMFALLKVAQQIRDVWRAEDTRAAQEQRAAADAEIKRLAEVAA
jgi:hypothetical protein